MVQIWDEFWFSLILISDDQEFSQILYIYCTNSWQLYQKCVLICMSPRGWQSKFAAARSHDLTRSTFQCKKQQVSFFECLSHQWLKTGICTEAFVAKINFLRGFGNQNTVQQITFSSDMNCSKNAFVLIWCLQYPWIRPVLLLSFRYYAPLEAVE